MSIESRRTAADVINSDPQYPATWKAFIGQEQAKEQLVTAARAAKQRKVAMPHTLIESGRPGIGKTALGLLSAKEMGAGVAIASGQLDIHDARMILSEMVDGDVLIIDECHRLVEGGKGKAEWLLHYMENGVLMTALGAEQVAKAKRLLEELGLAVATPNDAREMLKLKGGRNVGF